MLDELAKDMIDERAFLKQLINFKQVYEQEGTLNEWNVFDFDLPFVDIQWNVPVSELVKFNFKPLFDQRSTGLDRSQVDVGYETELLAKYGLDTTVPIGATQKVDVMTKASLDKIAQYFSKPELHSNMKQLSEIFKEPLRCKYSISIYYPVQFECLRLALGYRRKDFIRTLIESHRWYSSGGQTNSDFFKSDNGRFIAKCVSTLEFETFKEQALYYFKYIFTSIFTGKETFLSKILGVAEMKIGKEDKKYLIIMEGVSYGLTANEHIKIFDLKGSKMNRFRRNKVRAKTNLDTNYLLERNGDPLVVRMPPDMDFFATLERDVAFLRDKDIVDYSLLLVVQTNEKLVRVGIIDYLRKYDLKKKIEFGLKKIKNLGQDPTIVNPSQYAERFLDFMRKCIVAKSAEE